MEADHETGRDAFVDYLRGQLIGPASGDEFEVIQDPPSARYLMATLFPRQTTTDESFEDDIEDEAAPKIGDDEDDDPVGLANQQMPSSAALSLVVAGAPVIRVRVSAATYLEQAGDWSRAPHLEVVEISSSSEPKISVFDGAAYIQAIWRSDGSRHLVTVALVNQATNGGAGSGDAEDCLFQVSIEIEPLEGVIAPYPTANSMHRDSEDEEMALLYRKVPAFAIGHGCAADWLEDDQGSILVKSEFMPTFDVPGVSFEVDGGGDIRTFEVLQRSVAATSEVTAGLARFVDGYRRWANELVENHSDVPPELVAAKNRILGRIQRAIERMDRGVELLRNDATVREAFALANRAMLMQMVHGSADRGKTRRKRDSEPIVTPDYDAQVSLGWRPFQLAFVLLALESISVEGCADTDVVDLIWFPTGGGKTEAYLGLIAVQIFLRRLRLGDSGAGTTVITRYTLRLLTSQQFQRAATLICACELLRREQPARLGSSRISIGMWVGGDTSPNSFEDAANLLEEIRAAEHPSVSFQLDLCPWCGTEMIPADLTSDDADYGVFAANDSFRMFCPSSSCPFHDHLPISAVDDDLYANPPTLLIATVDKFARMAWKTEPGVFVGAGSTPGPDLVIQDELHLISGPLGTVTSLYEHAIDVVMEFNGRRPKIVASTATIRRADQQVQGLFGREVFLFPPAGLDVDDSYFVRTDRSRPGRLYVGAMAQSHSPMTAVVHSSAALLEAPVELGRSKALTEAEVDQYWTLVAYHNSLRELGRTVTLARDDIPARIKVIASDQDDLREIDAEEDVIELTSNIAAVQIPRYLERLMRLRGSRDCVSFVACTNMISVGVDVDRLGLMLVNGQPKSTSEYIQASSRVGRRDPGLVFVLYSAAKSRDRSHYESFRPYHSSLYRHVEPTSVTPFALPARARALRAAIVILVRHGLQLGSEDQAGQFDPEDPRFGQLVQRFLERVEVADTLERQPTALEIEDIVAEWSQRIADGSASPGGLKYTAKGKQFESLLKGYGELGAGWETLNSMRNIDVSSLLKVRGAD